MQPTIEVRKTDRFDRWLVGLRDPQARRQVAKRILRLSQGHFGLRRVLGDGVWELKIDAGPGYRIYYRFWHGKIVLLLCGGDKGSQERDIAIALKMAKELE